VTLAWLYSCQGAFLVHYLNEVVAPNFPVALLAWGAIGVCFVNLGIYVHRHLRARREALSAPYAYRRNLTLRTRWAPGRRSPGRMRTAA
jgi:hypothetical protein